MRAALMVVAERGEAAVERVRVPHYEAIPPAQPVFFK